MCAKTHLFKNRRMGCFYFNPYLKGKTSNLANNCIWTTNYRFANLAQTVTFTFFYLILSFYIFRENTGGITFGDFMNFLSTLSKGTLQEKIYWSFRFYDVNKDGIISRDEMIKVMDTWKMLTSAEVQLDDVHDYQIIKSIWSHLNKYLQRALKYLHISKGKASQVSSRITKFNSSTSAAKI